MQGRRLPDITNVNDWMFAKDSRDEKPTQPGEYIVQPARDAVWCCLPNGVTVRIPIKDLGGDEPIWGFTEHDDGTITLSPSINLHPAPGRDGWHGFLERGVWREV